MQKNRIHVPEWALAPALPGIVYEGMPRQYRFDGEAGVFLVGEMDAGDHLVVQIFDRRFVTGERWGRPSQTWIDLAFVDEQGIVSVLALKKESAINLMEFFLADLRGVGDVVIDPMAVRARLTVAERQGEDGSYFVVVVSAWDFVTEQSYRDVSQFAHSGQFRWILLGESGV